ncbi:MAG TPA: WD40 repeat domain-containing protein, partial [Anaeromyxobacter sp.]
MGRRSRSGSWSALAVAGAAVLAACGPGSGATSGGSSDGGGNHGGGPTPIGVGAAGCATSPGATPTQGAKVPLGTQGPWTSDNCTYGVGNGLKETWIVDVTTDEAQNRWIATPNALYLATPGGAFRRYDERDGLHLGAITGRTPGPIGWVEYCDDQPRTGSAACAGQLKWGGANESGIRSVAGGAPNEVFVGYHGSKTIADDTCGGAGPDWCDPMTHSGKIDRVRLNADGSITVTRFDYWVNNHNLGYWHNRTPFRLLYDHVYHPGTIYAANDHGIVIVFPDRWTPYTGTSPSDLDPWLAKFVGDHLHAEVCYHQSCASGGAPRAGDWRGLWLDSNGSIWHAGMFNAGLATWDSDPVNWWGRWGAAFQQNFGDPYVLGGPAGTEPVFKVPMEGDPVNLTAVSICPDGKVWFGSYGPTSVTETVASWTGSAGFKTYDPRTLGLSDRAVQDLVCLP